MVDSNSKPSSIRIPLTQGQSTIIDSKHADLVDLGWYAIASQNTFYAVRNDPPTGNNRRHERLHRVIMSRKLGRPLDRRERVDHVDLDGLNNLEENLRLATPSQNAINSLKQRNSQSPYKGVGQLPSGKWIARIRKDNVRHYLGVFPTAEDAYRAYCSKMEELYGVFANFENERIR